VDFSQLIYGIPIAGALALVVALMKSMAIKKQPEGTDKMKEIGGHIRDGAMAFLSREYKVLAIFVIVVAIALGVMNNGVPGSHWLVAVSFIVSPASPSAPPRSPCSPASAAASTPRPPTSAPTWSARSKPASPRTTRATPPPSPTTSATTSATSPAWAPTSSSPTSARSSAPWCSARYSIPADRPEMADLRRPRRRAAAAGPRRPRHRGLDPRHLLRAVKEGGNPQTALNIGTFGAGDRDGRLTYFIIHWMLPAQWTFDGEGEVYTPPRRLLRHRLRPGRRPRHRPDHRVLHRRAARPRPARSPSSRSPARPPTSSPASAWA
jgi:preprotein translocase subunit SecG